LGVGGAYRLRAGGSGRLGGSGALLGGSGARLGGSGLLGDSGTRFGGGGGGPRRAGGGGGAISRVSRFKKAETYVHGKAVVVVEVWTVSVAHLERLVWQTLT